MIDHIIELIVCGGVHRCVRPCIKLLLLCVMSERLRLMVQLTISSFASRVREVEDLVLGNDNRGQPLKDES